MKINLALVTLYGTTLGLTSLVPVGVWQSPGATDLRSPCPMVNALANHGYLPRDGVNVSMADLITGFNASVNLESAATQLVGAKALLTSTTGNASTFNLDDLDTHGIIEHDGSLSRDDIYFGDDHSFNATKWNSVAAYFTDSTISFETAAAAHKFALTSSAAINPTFNMTSSDQEFSFIESALYMTVFANGTSDSSVTSWVDYLFNKEELPYTLGWTRPIDQITVASVLGAVAQLEVLDVL